MAEVELISNQWKHTLETTPKSSVTSLVSLYDLFYDQSGNLWVESTDPTAGTKLEHDIICLNKNMLKSDTSIDQSMSLDMNTSLWYTYGIDISIPIFDARAKSKPVLCSASIGEIANSVSVFPDSRYYIYDKDAALAPSSIDIFTTRGVLTANTIQSPTWDNYLPPSIGTFSASGDTTMENSDIILSCPDTVFKSTLVTQDGFEAYNRIMVNPYTLFGVCLVVKATGMNYTGLLGNGNFYISSGLSYTNTFEDFYNFWNRSDTIGNFVARSVDLGTNSHYTQDSVETKETYDSNRWFELLKNTFVYVRAPFYGDYVVPDNFEQDLNQNAKVVHNELMLSGAGDFKKYDKYASSTAQIIKKNGGVLPDDFVSEGIGTVNFKDLDGIGASERTLPYIPKTSPTVDIYTSRLLDSDKYLHGIKEREDLTNFSSKLNFNPSDNKIDKFLENEVSGNDMLVQGLPVAAINRSNASSYADESTDNLTPPNWFDPESRKTDKYYSSMGKFPSVVPSDGNLYVDGRIIGPTIDEIWIMLKKLTGGRLSDFVKDGDSTSPANLSRALNLDIGIPYGSDTKSQNDTDTTMVEVPDSEFNFKYDGSTENNKHGDPIDFLYTPDNDGSFSENSFGQSIKITKFINQNDAIVYPIYSSLKLLSDDITTFDTTDLKERGIKNFTAWNNLKSKENPIGDNATVVTGAWGPRATPYSLRELEAMVMGNKFNIITQARFLKENFAVTGKLGKTHGFNKDDMSNFTSGSLYQMHRNYNFDVSNPNTYYDVTGTEDGYKYDSEGQKDGKIYGTKAVIDDDDLRTDEQIKVGHIRFADTYGTSKAISYNQEFYSSSDVYLSAYGDWRFVSDHMRAPVLREEF